MWGRIAFYSILALFFIGPLWLAVSGKVNLGLDWRTASRESTGIAPEPAAYCDAVIQIYAARTYSWRGLFSVHMWMAIKPSDAKNYTIYQVVGWNYFFGLPALSVRNDIPDREWFGQKPQLVKDMRGADAEKLIPKIEQAIHNYPYVDDYTLWPGPNSNTFLAYIGRQVPELKLTMPPNAIGKDYLGIADKFFARAPSGTGYQFSFYGLLGVILAKQEGLEINILGLVIGFSLAQRAFILPGFGYLTF